MLEARGHEYPTQEIVITPFEVDRFTSLFPQPRGLTDTNWPPVQLTYAAAYLEKLGCRTVLEEHHYIDRDFILDLSLFYSRSLRNYPNHCQRLHFFSISFDADDWSALVDRAASGHFDEVQSELQSAYLGFMVIRPLAGSPVGRTVMRTFGPLSDDGSTRDFAPIRTYQAHIAGFDLSVEGLAFQQQDQGVSACATTAIWCAVHGTAPKESLPVPTPAEITEAASRYLLMDGRALPSEGLTIHQICEAIRAAGLAPLVYRARRPELDAPQLLGYIASGFAPVIAIQSVDGDEGHALCGVGLKLGDVKPQTDPQLNYRDAATAIEQIYVHDDRLGPYARAQLFGHTVDGNVRTGLEIRWPDQSSFEISVLAALIIPVPVKLRLTVTRMRELGLQLAELTGLMFPEMARRIILDYRYHSGTEYRKASYGFGLSSTGLRVLACGAVLSRYVGVVAIRFENEPLFDVVLDATETRANPSALLLVSRCQNADNRYLNGVRLLAEQLAAPLVA